MPGEKLVVADEAGNVELWTFKDHVLNDWTLIGSTVFPGEHILGAAWFHNGKKVLQIFLLTLVVAFKSLFQGILYNIITFVTIYLFSFSFLDWLGVGEKR